MYTDPPEVGPKNGECALDSQVEKPETFHHDSLPRSGKPTPNNLARHRWWGPILDAGEERDLIRRAQAGDKPALTTLLQKFHRLVLSIAQPYCGDPAVERQAKAWGVTTHDSPERDDLIAAGVVGLTTAIRRFDLRRNSGRLSSYAKSYIQGATSAEVRRYKQGGFSGETRLERWIASHPYDDAAEIADAMRERGMACTTEQAAEAQQLFTARRNTEHYSTTDADYDDEDNFIGARPAASHEVHGMYGAFGTAPHLSFHKAACRWVDDLIRESERRALRRLKAIGRRAYALELVARDHARIAARADPQQYLYPPGAVRGNEFKTWFTRGSPMFGSKYMRTKLGVEPIAPAQPRRKRKSQRQPRKRYWRSWEDRTTEKLENTHAFRH